MKSWMRTTYTNSLHVFGKSVIGAAVAVSALNAVHAFDFSTADELFSKRGETYLNAMKAFDIYAKAVAETSGEEQEYAAIQLGRSALFAGQVFAGVDKETKKKIFERCTNSLAPAKASNSQAYHYYYLSCAAFRGKLANLLNRVAWGKRIKDGVSGAVASMTVEGTLQPVVEGGGTARVMAAVRSNRAAKVVGLFDADEAVTYAEAALSAPARFDKYLQVEMSGLDHYENYVYLGLAKTVRALENSDFAELEDAFYVLEDGLDSYNTAKDEGTLSSLRAPENEVYSARIATLYNALEGCIADESSWKSCAENALKATEDKRF